MPRSPVADPADPAAVIRSQVVLEEHDLSPDGSFAIVVRRVVRRNRYVSHLWLVPLDGRRVAAPRRLTEGSVRDSRPRISPDGTRVAFRRRLAGDDIAAARLVVLGLRPGSRPVAVTAPRVEVSEAEWSPDGSRLAFTAETDPPRFIVGPEPRRGDEPLARRITRIDWRYDEVGHLDRWAHLHVVDPRRGARAHRLTRGDFGVSGIAWHPDGGSIAFAADRKRDADIRPGTSIWAVDVPPDAGESADAEPVEPREVLALRGWANGPAFSPDGGWLVAIGVDDPDAPDDVSPSLFAARVPAGPRRARVRPVPLAPDLDRPIGPLLDTDLTGWTADARPGPCWFDERTIVAVASDRGRALPVAFGFDPATGRADGPPRWLATADTVCLSLAARGGTVSALGTLGGRAPELMTIEGGEVRLRSRFGSAWQRSFPWPAMELVEAPGPSGPIETWIASPPDAGPAALPTVVDVHGGPLGAWSPAPSIEVMLLTNRGYRVLMPNIRGSATYGREWITPQLGDWGGVDADDVHAVVDHAVALGLADAARLGVLGLSYGGFMVHWLIGTSDRFSAAVSENGVANQVSAWANSDTGVEYCRASNLGAPLSSEGVDRLWRQSPLRNVASIRTPLLMLQGEADRRCPPADNEQLFVALRALRREVEYVLYPEEFHGLQAAGRPDRRIDRMSRMLDWFDRHLRGRAERPPASPVSRGRAPASRR
ncbi:MAG TPA: prolyl oligopeptidase family serine peptidase [Candidatus Limnocylindrales bacterium]|nr:prolyl oligopeptidase family serine peptidase [Candidatus Limnocylindrales bacterium]